MGSLLAGTKYAPWGARGSCVVALRASTGELVWAYQTVHHDLSDYDVPMQPILFTPSWLLALGPARRAYRGILQLFFVGLGALVSYAKVTATLREEYWTSLASRRESSIYAFDMHRRLNGDPSNYSELLSQLRQRQSCAWGSNPRREL
jgi:PQQ enzyme repeat